jgi:hypothetical protein
LLTRSFGQRAVKSRRYVHHTLKGASGRSYLPAGNVVHRRVGVNRPGAHRRQGEVRLTCRRDAETSCHVRAEKEEALPPPDRVYGCRRHCSHPLKVAFFEVGGTAPYVSGQSVIDLLNQLRRNVAALEASQLRPIIRGKPISDFADAVAKRLPPRVVLRPDPRS